jgi:cation transport protein ChaC
MSLTRADLESSQIQQAIAFVVNPQHRAYAGHLAPDVMVEHIATARGTLGSCAEYLAQTVEGLAQAGIKDKALLQLVITVDLGLGSEQNCWKTNH